MPNWMLCAAGEASQLNHSSLLLSGSTDSALQLLQTWITQPGVPLLTLSIDASSQSTVTQSRHYDWGLSVAGDPFAAANDSAWYVPINMGSLGSPATAGDAEATWLELSDQSQLAGTVDDVILNPDGSGYYRSAALSIISCDKFHTNGRSGSSTCISIAATCA